MRQLFCIILFLVISDFAGAQSTLLHPSIVDTTLYYDKETKKVIYPKLGLALIRDDSVFYHGVPIFYKEKSELKESLYFEMFTDSILIINYRGKNDIGRSDPIGIKRYCMRIICLKQPGKIYSLNLQGSRIASSEEVFAMFKSAEEDMNFISSIDFTNNQLILMNTKIGIRTFSLQTNN